MHCFLLINKAAILTSEPRVVAVPLTVTEKKKSDFPVLVDYTETHPRYLRSSVMAFLSTDSSFSCGHMGAQSRT